MPKRPDSKMLQTTAEVMAELGGPAKVATMTGADYKTVWPWDRSETFPARYFFLMSHALALRGLSAPPELWGQVLPVAAEVAKAALSKGRAA